MTEGHRGLDRYFRGEAKRVWTGVWVGQVLAGRGGQVRGTRGGDARKG